MPKYLYQAKTPLGKLVVGQIIAIDDYDLQNKFKEMKITPLKVVKSGQNLRTGKVSAFAGRVKSRELQIFTRQFATLINSGIPITESLKILSEGKKDRKLKAATTSVLQSIESGKSLADAMTPQGQVFDRLFVNMIRAGEEGGILDVILNRMAVYLEKTEKIKKQVIGALFYPAIIILVAIAVVTAILVFIIPKFEELYMSSKKELPWLTAQVMILSKSIMANWYYYIAGIIAIPMILTIYFRTENGKVVLDHILIKIPLMGDLVLKSGIARMSRTLSTLLSSGVGVIEALEIAGKTSGSTIIEKILMKAKESVTVGKPLVVPLAKEKLMPDMVVQMIRIGEQSGTLDTMLGKIADFYEDDVENAVKALTSMIEPLLMVVLGVVIAILVVAMYLPIFDMANVGAGG